MNSLILIRGLPGSGKTTLANLLSENNQYPVFSVDEYFTNPQDDTYEFRYQENHLAYKSCLEKTRLSMEEKTPKIFVANTFVYDWEMEPYFQLAKEFSYQLHSVVVENRHFGKNIHEIPEEQIQKMKNKFGVSL